MTHAQFEKIVREALRALPKRFKHKLKNIDIVVEPGTADGDTMGLYEGVPLGERGGGYSMAMPDKITLYKRAIEAECKEHKLDIGAEIRRTIEHEIAHHFGMRDEELEEGGIY